MSRPRHMMTGAAIKSYVEQVTEALPGEIVSVILFGSHARGDARAESDIDLLTIIRRESPELEQTLTEIAWQVQFEHNVVISDIIRTTAEWEKMKAHGFPFYRNVSAEGILLWSSTSATTPAYV